MKKKPFLILEATIALVLITVLIGIVFSSYQQLVVSQHYLKESKKSILSQKKLQLRLKQIFSNVISFEKKNEHFYLVTYDNKGDLDPLFRGQLQGMFYIDSIPQKSKSQRKLVLTTWPKKGDPRLEVLFENIESFSFLFFDEQKKEWTDHYPKTTPFMIKLFIDKNRLVIPLFL